MKIKLIIPFILILFLGGCKEEKKIEIIPNLEEDYFSENEVNKPVLPILRNAPATSSEDQKLVEAINDRNKKLVEAIRLIHDSQLKDTVRYIIKLRLYINENGEVEKVKDISNHYDRAEYSRDGIMNYNYRDKMNKALVTRIRELAFESAEKEGVKVKSWTDLKGINILAIPDGRFQIDQNPDYLTKAIDSYKEAFHLQQRLSDSYNRWLDANDGYSLAAENMPEPIGGIGEIQKKIVYPDVAKQAGIEGRVHVLAFIDEAGNVVDAQIVKGIGAGCDDAALNAIKAVKFIPGKKDGKPIKVKVTIPIVFKLQ